MFTNITSARSNMDNKAQIDKQMEPATIFNVISMRLYSGTAKLWSAFLVAFLD